MKTYLFSYPYDGAQYSFSVTADSLDQAMEMQEAMGEATYDGEVVMAVPVGNGLIARFLAWWYGR